MPSVERVRLLVQGFNQDRLMFRYVLNLNHFPLNYERCVIVAHSIERLMSFDVEQRTM